MGPIWYGGNKGEEELLTECYRHSLDIAMKHDIRSVAFPSISTGVYSYPVDKAAKVAVMTVKNVIKENPDAFDDIVWVLFDERTQRAYEMALQE